MGITEEDSIPGVVSNVKVEPTPGGAILTYTLPDDENLSYVEAIVKKPEGKTVNFLSSSFRDTISVVGLGSTAEQEVLIYSVSRGGMKSQPVSVKINPLTPPHIGVLSSLAISEGLGGVNVNYVNQGGADLAFYFGIVEDGKFVEKDIKYSDAINGRILFWGYPSEEQEFALYVRDRWDHYSDTVYATVTPLPEVMLDKSKFKVLQLQYDGTYQTDTYQRPENLWDGAWSQDYTNPFSLANWRHGAIYQQADGSPAALTIDLGEYVNISRIRVNHYWKYNTNEGGTSKGGRKWEIYGLIGYKESTVPFSYGEWTNWSLLAQMENVRPSNVGGSAQDDALAWQEGTTELFTPPTEAVRYIRIKAIEAWSGLKEFDFAEITVYGQSVK